MPVRPILQLGDPVLRQTALPVADATTQEISTLVCDLADTLAHWRAKTGYGRGIATPQIGAAAGDFPATAGRKTLAAGESGNC
jgi:peptide deformylase